MTAPLPQTAARRAPWWKTALAALAELPSTNFKAVVGSGLFALYVATLCVCLVRGIAVPDGLAFTVGSLILGYLGIQHFDFRVKRQTYRGAPPAAPDVEDAKAGATTAPEAADGQ